MSTPNKPQQWQNDEINCKFAAKTLLKLMSGFEEQIDGIIKNEDDIEYVHKARVSSRRLRAALPLFRFCFPPDEFKEWVSKIKKVTPLLANARDLDVQIAFIEKYMKRLKSTSGKQVIDVLLEDHIENRKNIQPSIVCELENLKKSNILQNIRKFCEQTISELSNTTVDPDHILRKAHWQISFKLDDFLSMEKYVYLENEKRNHHLIRIYAKKLRYTLEVFAPLFKNKLNRQIETIKAFQDVLGEMHDCDVWTNYIPEFIGKPKSKVNTGNKANLAKTEKALLNFSNYMKLRRKQFYRQFVDLWNTNKKRSFFIQLRKTINVGLQMSEDKKQQILAKPNSTIALLSDIHANLSALQRVFEDADKRGADIYLNAGDSIGFGPCPNEVVELLCEKNVLSILGNYDVEVIERKAKAKGEKSCALKFARKEIAKSVECYLSSFPHELRLKVAGKKLLVTHGSPESIEEHIYHNTEDERLKILAKKAKADIIVVGHSHEQFWKQANGASFINPGSVGRPGDGNPQTGYALLTFDPLKVEFVRLDYDIESVADALRKKRLPESFSQMLLRGVSLDSIVNEDEAKKEDMVQNCKATVEKSKEISKKYWPDSDHYLQVTCLALRFFDELSDLHQLGQRERCWLECAATLHDVGLSESGGSHHKKTAKLILNDTKLPFTSQERRIIASIARYHRKALPKKSHYNLAALDCETVHKVGMLASLLRVADGLDYAHQSNINVLSIRVGTKRVYVECLTEANVMVEEQAFNKKKDLFEKVFAKKLVLTWKKQ
jgi:putative phosphoesterase